MPSSTQYSEYECTIISLTECEKKCRLKSENTFDKTTCKQNCLESECKKKAIKQSTVEFLYIVSNNNKCCLHSAGDSGGVANEGTYSYYEKDSGSVTSAEQCKNCPVGRYSDKVGISEEKFCQFCPPGSQVLTAARPGASNKNDVCSQNNTCPPGTFSLLTNKIVNESSPCTVCPVGRYNDQTGLEVDQEWDSKEIREYCESPTELRPHEWNSFFPYYDFIVENHDVGQMYDYAADVLSPNRVFENTYKITFFFDSARSEWTANDAPKNDGDFNIGYGPKSGNSLSVLQLNANISSADVVKDALESLDQTMIFAVLKSVHEADTVHYTLQ